MRRNLVPRYAVLTLGYAVFVLLAGMIALQLRYDGSAPPEAWGAWLGLAPAFTAFSLLGFLVAGLFHGLWRYAGTATMVQVFKGATLSAIALAALLIATPTAPFTLGFVALVWACELALVGGARVAWRLWRESGLGPPLDVAPAQGQAPSFAVRALVVGAGPAGVHLVQQMRRGRAGRRPMSAAGFLDEDPRLTGKQIEGVRVLGTRAALPNLLAARAADLVVLSDPALPAPTVREIVAACERAGVRVRALPGLSDPGRAASAVARLREVGIEDLLGRRAVQLDLGEIRSFLKGQRVLVTGAGGSIGAELARQAAEFAPAAIGLLDRAENGLYYVHQELGALHPRLAVEAIVADVRDPRGLEEAFSRVRPTVVLHAAAHKHVPLLEAHPREAVLNNVTGTRMLAEAAERHGVGKVVLISTDKAVRPTSVMGATKRVCELLLQARAGESRTRFVAVRFGNVLGSEGSVVPLFQRQIERGGPVRVTDPEARRYFMTTFEAARLVLQAGAMGEGGELFLLDMGEQVRILDLARQMIRIAGLREGEDIEIAFTGLRPGEKLYEELHTASERARMTRHERILKWEVDAIDGPRLLAGVADLEAAAERNDAPAIRKLLHALVPEFQEDAGPSRERAPATPMVGLPATPTVRVPSPPAAPAPAGPPVEPPAARAGEEPRVRPRTGPDRVRRFTDAALAAALLAISSPLWTMVWLEARARGRRDWLEERVYVGRSRRGSRTRDTAGAGERSAESRAVDLMGTPIRCARFRGDVGPVSRWLARRGLDRLPMLRNVVSGELAMVGPSPIPQGSVTRWATLVAGIEQRFGVRPGVTGLAQLSGDRDEGPAGVVRRAALDLDYVARRTAWLDLVILARTVGFVLAPPRRIAPDAQTQEAGAGRTARGGGDTSSRSSGTRGA